MLGCVIDFQHVDVFTAVPYAGNSLAVFVDPPALTTSQFLAVTQELRHFESIFVTTGDGVIDARVFDLDGELDFAGHPVLGAAAVLHERTPGDELHWRFRLPAREVSVTTFSEHGHVSATLDQGRPEFGSRVADRDTIAAAFGLAGLDPELPAAVVSTGLRYLIVPVLPGGLARARVAHPDLGGYLASVGAQFAYLLDASALAGRHWNNDGLVEDVATGSAAGCVAAYLRDQGRLADGERVFLAQGQYVGWPSRIAITAYGRPGDIERVVVGGDVAFVGAGRLRAVPA